MATVVGTLQVDLVTNTASFSFDDAQLKARKGAKDIEKEVNSMDFREARGTIALLGEDLGLGLPRHLQGFIAALPGVAGPMAAAFSAAAVITLISKIAEATEKSDEHKKKLQEGAEAAQDAARGLTQHAEALQISNLRLQDQINILQKKPAQNGPKIAALEAKQAVDNLIDSFVKAIDKQKELFQSQVQGTLSKFFNGDGAESEASRQVIERIEAIKEAELDYNRARSLGDEEETQKALHRLEERKAGVKAFVADAIKQFEELSHQADQEGTLPNLSSGGDFQGAISLDKERESARQFKETLETLYGTFIQSDKAAAEQIQHGSLQAQKDELEATKKLAPAIVDLTHELNKKSKVQELAAKIAKEEAQAEVEAAQALARSNEEQAKSAQKVIASQQEVAKAWDAITEQRRKAADQDKLDDIAMQEATGLITKREALQERIQVLTQAQKDEEAKVNKELAERKALLDQLAAKTGADVGMAGLLGSDADKEAYNKALADYLNFQKQKEAISRQYSQQIAQTQQKFEEGSFQSMLQKMSADMGNWSQQTQNLFKSTFDGMNGQLQSFLMNGKTNWRQFGAEAITQLIMMGVKWVESHTLMAAANKLFHSQAEEDDTEGTATTLAANEIAAQSAAALAFVNTLASASLEDPFAAAAMAATNYSLAESFAALAGSAAGGALLPNSEMFIHTHPEEMILPRHISNFITDSVKRNGGSGGDSKSIHQTYAPTFNHIAGEQYLQDMINRSIKKEMSAQMRYLRRQH